jgi:two-component system, LytTR family, response regulator
MYVEQKNKVYIPIHYGFIVNEAEHITHCVAEGSYTWVHFDNRKPVIATRRISVLQALLKDSNFIRCHKSFLVNIFFIKEFYSKEKNMIILDNGVVIKVAIRKLKEFKLTMKRSYITIPA